MEPRLVVVSGPPGSGKTTLAHRLASSVGCPAICRDEIKEGMVHAHGPGFAASVDDPLTRRTYPLFFDVIRLLLESGVTVVAEAAFQHRLWEQGLTRISDLAAVRVVRCWAAQEEMLRRRRLRAAGMPTRVAHADDASVHAAAPQRWDAIHIDSPTIDVNTDDGYSPDLGKVTTFVSA